MRPIRILIFAATTVLSTLAGHALLAPSRPNLTGVAHVSSSQTIATSTISSTPISQEEVRPRVTRSVPSQKPRVITEIQYVDAPTPRAPQSMTNLEHEVEQAESENDHDD